MIKQAIRLFGKHGTVIGQVVAVDRNKLGYSAIHPGDEYSDELAIRISTGRAMKKPITLEDVKEKATSFLTTAYIEYCETDLLKKLYASGGSKKTVRDIINEDIINNSKRYRPEMMCDRVDDERKLFGFEKDGDELFRMTAAEIAYPYLVVMNDRMNRYFAKMTADEFDTYRNKLKEVAEVQTNMRNV